MTQVTEARRILQWTYVFAHYLPQEAEKRLFEYLQVRPHEIAAMGLACGGDMPSHCHCMVYIPLIVRPFMCVDGTGKTREECRAFAWPGRRYSAAFGTYAPPPSTTHSIITVLKSCAS